MGPKNPCGIKTWRAGRSAKSPVWKKDGEVSIFSAADAREEKVTHPLQPLRPWFLHLITAMTILSTDHSLEINTKTVLEGSGS